MPSWLISALWSIGEKLLILALKFLESKYPGLKVVLDKVLEILGAANPPDAKVVTQQLDARWPAPPDRIMK